MFEVEHVQRIDIGGIAAEHDCLGVVLIQLVPALSRRLVAGICGPQYRTVSSVFTAAIRQLRQCANMPASPGSLSSTSRLKIIM